MKEIQLTQGKITLVDDEDYERVSQYKWFAHKENIRFYAWGRINKKIIKLHRFIMNIHNPKILVDHINGNGLDNRKENLRFCSASQNNFNRKPIKNISGYKGVRKELKSKNWSARIYMNYKEKYLGSFITKEDAAKAYNEAAIKYFGEFANLNIIKE